MKDSILKYLNPPLFRARREIADLRVKLTEHDQFVDGLKTDSSKIFESYTSQIKDMTERAESLQKELNAARAQIDSLIAEKQTIIDSHKNGQNESVLLLDKARKDLEHLREEHQEKLDQISMMKRQLARLRVWILRTHRVDLSSFMGIIDKSETVESAK